MKFVNDEAVNVNGTSFMGYVKTTYADLVEKFGEPTYTYGDKTTVEWVLEFETDGELIVATIYDYKMLETPYGEFNWHVGGFSIDAVYAVETVLGRLENEYIQI